MTIIKEVPMMRIWECQTGSPDVIRKSVDDSIDMADDEIIKS